MATYKGLKRLYRIWQAFRKGETFLTYPPLRIWIELTDHCNLKCPLCPNQLLPKGEKGYISLELFKKIIDQISREVYDLNLFHRGEPLLHPHLIELITYAQGRGIPCRIHTNATVLSNSLSKQILTAGLEILSFSFDGYKASLYEKNRYPAKFEETLGNIKHFLALKKESKKRKPITVLQMMSVEENHPGPELKKLVSSLKVLGLNRVVFRRPHNWGGAVSLSLESSTDHPKDLFTCTFPWYALIIYWDGRVGPCPQDFFGRMIMGDLNQQTIPEIWNGPVMQELRAKIRDRQYPVLEPCRQCDRPRRKTFSGIPREYLKSFVKENISGYR
ncbi:MAG: radical SAM/SPASM domain-containing protein [Pseudomonadota bacterium]